MLPQDVLDTFIVEMPDRIYFDPKVYASDPSTIEKDRDYFEIAIRWPWDQQYDTDGDGIKDSDFSQSAPPSHVYLRQKMVGVTENSQPIDEYFGEEVLNNIDPEIADIARVEGRFVYDILEIQVNCEGPQTICLQTDSNGDCISSVTLGEQERARKVAGRLHNFFLHEWDTRPVDQFIIDPVSGEPKNVDNLDSPDDPDYTHEVYADELIPPIRIQPITGRGLMNTTQMLDADGAQFNTAVELGYVDSVVEYLYSAKDSDFGDGGEGDGDDVVVRQ